MTKFQVGQKVVDQDGLVGRVTKITEYEGKHWYDVNFGRAEDVRFENELRPA